MTGWLRRLRGAIGLGVTWAFAWALGGLLMGITSKLLPFVPLRWFFNIFDAPLPALAVPGFFGGLFFSLVLGIAARKRTFHQLSMARFTAWGAMGGAALALFPVLLDAIGPASLNVSPVSILAAIGPPFIVFGAASAAATLALARRGEPGALGSPAGQAALGHGHEDGVLGVDELHDRRPRVL